MMATTSFALDIRPMFSDEDVDHMRDEGVDLSAYDVVRARSQDVLERVKRTGRGRMPPPPRAAWSAAQIELFERWIAETFPA